MVIYRHENGEELLEIFLCRRIRLAVSGGMFILSIPIAVVAAWSSYQVVFGNYFGTDLESRLRIALCVIVICIWYCALLYLYLRNLYVRFEVTPSYIRKIGPGTRIEVQAWKDLERVTFGLGCLLIFTGKKYPMRFEYSGSLTPMLRPSLHEFKQAFKLAGIDVKFRRILFLFGSSTPAWKSGRR